MKRIIALCLLLALPLQVRAAPPEMPGKSSLLMEAATGTVLWEQNAREPLPPASVTKIMTLLLIMEAVDSGRLRWEDPVTASEAAAAKGGSQVYLKAGETMSVSDMVKSIAVSSANDCACAMAELLAGSEAAFVEQMNEKAKNLGMTDTCFVNCTGLDDGPEADRHRTSARDIGIMSRELLKNHPDIKKFTTIWMDSIRNGTFGLSNTNKLIRFYPGATGLKTGFTSGAGYCLSASAEREGMELIAVILGCKTSAQRNAACKAMLDGGFAAYTLLDPLPEAPEPVPVVLGKADSVALIPGESCTMVVEKAKKSQIRTEISPEPSVFAPVSRGQRLGTLTVRCGEQILAQVPLVAQTAVEKLGWGDLFCRVLRRTAMAKETAPAA